MSFHPAATVAHSPYTPNVAAAEHVSRRVFGSRWRVAACISWAESRDELAARNGVNLGPWQINVKAHPWVNAHRLVSSWAYSARVAYTISQRGTSWSPWTTHSSCGV